MDLFLLNDHPLLGRNKEKLLKLTYVCTYNVISDQLNIGQERFSSNTRDRFTKLFKYLGTLLNLLTSLPDKTSSS